MAMMLKTDQPVSQQSIAVPTEPIWRLSVAQYHAMIQAGILTDDDHIELLEGWLVQKMSKNPPHRVVTGLIRQALERLISDGWYVDSQEPITTLDSEPEPDVTVVRGARLDYLDRHPGAQDVGLVIEISDATLNRDQGLKKRMYARAGIPVYWLVNLVKDQIEVYSQPIQTGKQPDYQQRQIYQISDAISVQLDGDQVGQINVREILPPSR